MLAKRKALVGITINNKPHPGLGLDVLLVLDSCVYLWLRLLICVKSMLRAPLSLLKVCMLLYMSALGPLSVLLCRSVLYTNS